MAPHDELPIECITITDGLIIRPIGDIDLNQAPTLRTHIAEAFQKTPARLIIDLSQVRYMDSSGVATLVEANATCHARRHKAISRSDAGSRAFNFRDRAARYRLHNHR